MPRRLQKQFLRRTHRNLKKPGKRRYRNLLLLFLALGLSVWVLLHFEFKQIEKEVEEKFSVSRRWNVPSRVYADSEYLYPGVNVLERRFVQKLERLSYRRVEEKIEGPGDFRVSKDEIDVYLHDFSYPEEKFQGFPIRLSLNQQTIQKIIDLETNETLSVARLEPEEIATLFDEKMEDRTLISLRDTPQYLLEAIILIEDERFFKHKGVDPIAIARAAVADLLAMKIVQGGSTLTQQLVKNFFLTAKKDFSRKVKEAFMAYVLEKRHTKAEILEAYLNEIYLGQRGPSSVTGVAEAAKHYFGKDIHQITLAESAMLAGMIRNPSEYAPLRNQEKSIARRNFVLKKMREENVITDAQYQTALKEGVITPKTKIKPVFAPYFIDFVKAQLSDLYPENVLETEGLRIFTTLDMVMQLGAEKFLNQGLEELKKNFSKQWPKDHQDLLQGCLIALSPHNGYVRAMVGGKDYSVSQFNRCVQAKRQPGSTFKPFVYLTALDSSRTAKFFTLADTIEDIHFTVDTPEGPWSPQNYDKQEHGLVTLRKALENSYNIATAKLAIEAGLEAIVKTARDAGIQSPLEPYPSLALGAFEVTPLEMISAFTIFPSLGIRSEPLALIHVMTPDGKVLERKHLQIQRAFQAEPVALVNTVLQGVIERGTAQGAKAYGISSTQAAGKTGTTSNYKDAWFSGFTSDLLSLVWVGFDDNTPIQMSGSRGALPIWASFMKEIHLQQWTSPQGLIQVSIDAETGGLATSSCPHILSEYFIPGTEPKEVCPHHGGKPIPKKSKEEKEEEF